MASRTYTGMCYIVAVDNDWFLPRGDNDWCDAPQYAQKYGKLKVAAGRAEAEKDTHPSHDIRAVRVHQTFIVEEL